VRATSSASVAADEEKPPARSYSCSAFEIDAIVSMIIGSLDLRSTATAYSFSGSWGASRSITPTLGKLMYRHVSRARPGETDARNRDTSIPATCRLAEPERGLDGAVISVTSAEIPAPMTTPTSSLRS
jgi:hypothetical protein